MEYANEVYDILDGIAERVVRAQDAVDAMIHQIRAFGDVPLFSRKDGKRENVIYLDDYQDRVKQRYLYMFLYHTKHL